MKRPTASGVAATRLMGARVTGAAATVACTGAATRRAATAAGLSVAVTTSKAPVLDAAVGTQTAPCAGSE